MFIWVVLPFFNFITHYKGKKNNLALLSLSDMPQVKGKVCMRCQSADLSITHFVLGFLPPTLPPAAHRHQSVGPPQCSSVTLTLTIFPSLEQGEKEEASYSDMQKANG